MKVSVIVPAYNVKPYLRACVDSVLAQSHDDIEIVLVDDGSTDGTRELCDEIASVCLSSISDSGPAASAVHQRSGLSVQRSIKVIHKPNGGLSDARNAGLRVATGDYIAFLDADDVWLLKDGLLNMVEALEKKASDLLLFLRVDIYPNRTNKGRDYDSDFIISHNSAEVFERLVLTERFNMSACFQLLRRQFLLDNNLFFEVGLLSEDVDWSIRLWQCEPSVQALNLPMYGYQHREGSITTTYSLKNLRSYDFMFTRWTERCTDNDKNDQVNCKIINVIRNYLANLYVSCLYAYRLIPSAEKSQARQILKSHMSLLNYAASPKSVRAKKILHASNFSTLLLISQIYTFLRDTIKGLNA